MPNVKIPEKVKAGDYLIIESDTEIQYAHVYESPREKFDESDTDKEQGYWRGDIYETSHMSNFSSDMKTVKLKMRRGPDNKPALYGNYLVRVGFENASPIEKFITVYV